MDDKKVLKSQKGGFDFSLLISSLLLLSFGLLIIYDASVVTAFRDFGDKLYFLKNQLVWSVISITALIFFSFFDYHKLIKWSPFMMLGVILLLILVLIPGIGTKVYGARRWINVAGFTFQPSEFSKLVVILYASGILAKLKDYKIKLLDLLTVLFFPILVITALVLVQPDLGTALIFVAITAILYFVGGGALWHFLVSIPLVFLAGIVAIATHPYRISRLKSFLDPTHDPQGASYQIYQILIAISAGGVFGVGLGASRSKFAFIPEVHSDAIFAIIVEELGFVGAALTIAAFLFVLSRALKIAKNAQDHEGQLLAFGITALIAIQSLFNIASIVALVPLTGIPLPFISYGGSFLLTTMVAIGILQNIKRQS